jgi:hypothetical protein
VPDPFPAALGERAYGFAGLRPAASIVALRRVALIDTALTTAARAPVLADWRIEDVALKKKALGAWPSEVGEEVHFYKQLVALECAYGDNKATFFGERVA